MEGEFFKTETGKYLGITGEILTLIKLSKIIKNENNWNVLSKYLISKGVGPDDNLSIKKIIESHLENFDVEKFLNELLHNKFLENLKKIDVKIGDIFKIPWEETFESSPLSSWYILTGIKNSIFDFISLNNLITGKPLGRYVGVESMNDIKFEGFRELLSRYSIDYVEMIYNTKSNLLEKISDIYASF